MQLKKANEQNGQEFDLSKVHQTFDPILYKNDQEKKQVEAVCKKYENAISGKKIKDIDFDNTSSDGNNSDESTASE